MGTELIAYAILIIITVIVQCIVNIILQFTANYIRQKNIPQKAAVILAALMYITILSLLFDVLLWAIVLMYFQVFEDFNISFTRCLNYFTTLGAGVPLPRKWELLGPIMSLNGIIIIAFAGSYMFGIAYGSLLNTTN